MQLIAQICICGMRRKSIQFPRDVILDGLKPDRMKGDYATFTDKEDLPGTLGYKEMKLLSVVDKCSVLVT